MKKLSKITVGVVVLAASYAAYAACGDAKCGWVDKVGGEYRCTVEKPSGDIGECTEDAKCVINCDSK